MPTQLIANQHAARGRWMHIATLGFNGPSAVELHDDPKDANCYRKYFAFDAVRWVYRRP